MEINYLLLQKRCTAVDNIKYVTSDLYHNYVILKSLISECIYALQNVVEIKNRTKRIKVYNFIKISGP